MTHTTTHFSRTIHWLAGTGQVSAVEEAFSQLVAFVRGHPIDDIDALVMEGDFHRQFPEFEEVPTEGTPEFWEDVTAAVPGNRRNAILAEDNDGYLDASRSPKKS